MTGKANYYTSGQYMDLCNKLFKSEKATPKGAIIVKITKVESIA